MLRFYFSDSNVIESVKTLINDGKQYNIWRYNFIDNCIVYVGKYGTWFYENDTWNKMNVPLIGDVSKCIRIEDSRRFENKE